MFHRCPAKRHTQSNDPSNGTFVASNVRFHECTPVGGDHESPCCASLRDLRIPVYIREVYKTSDSNQTHQTTDRSRIVKRERLEEEVTFDATFSAW